MIVEIHKAPAKINWSLKIGDLQPNGLHQIETDIQKIGLADELVVTLHPQAHNSEIRLSVEADLGCEAPADERNLVSRAVRAFFLDEPFPSMEIILRKNIPSEAGLGGGSSDAVAILRFLASHFSKPETEVKKIAAALGSELPFFLDEANRAIVSGTGEIVSPQPAQAIPIVLCLPPDTRVSTAWAFQTWDELPVVDRSRKAPNDFESPVLQRFPELQRICETFRQHGATYAGLSGSGATVFAAFVGGVPTDLIFQLRQKGFWVWSGSTLI